MRYHGDRQPHMNHGHIAAAVAATFLVLEALIEVGTSGVPVSESLPGTRKSDSVGGVLGSDDQR